MSFLPRLYLCLAGLFCLIIFSGEAHAADTNTKVRLHVLSLECVLEKISDGITDISSLTPADCEEEIDSLPSPPESGGIVVTPSENETGESAAFETAGPQEPQPQINDLQIESGPVRIVEDVNPLIKIITTLFQLSIGSIILLLLILFVLYVVVMAFLKVILFLKRVH